MKTEKAESLPQTRVLLLCRIVLTGVTTRCHSRYEPIRRACHCVKTLQDGGTCVVTAPLSVIIAVVARDVTSTYAQLNVANLATEQLNATGN